MQNLEKVLKTLENLNKECDNLTGDEIGKAIPQDPEEAIKALYKIGNEVSLVFRKLTPLRDEVVNKRVNLERQLKEKNPQ